MTSNANANGTPVVNMAPRDHTAERWILGSMIRYNDCISEVVRLIGPESIYADCHKKIFTGIVALYAQQTPVDLVTLANWLLSKNWIEDIGGYVYLSELWDVSPTSANVSEYSKIIKDKALCREIIVAASDMMRDAYEPMQPIEDVLGKAESRINQICNKQIVGETVTLGVAINQTIDLIDKRATSNGRDGMLLTGYMDLDEKISGLHNQELMVIAARPSVGKTALALNLIANITIARGYPTYFASLEQSRNEISERFLSMHAGVCLHVIRKGTLKDSDVLAIQAATERISGAPLVINDDPNQGMLNISANARRMRSREGLRLLVVDYLQLIEPENHRDNRNEQVSQCTRRLKKLARELDIPIIVLSQLNREAADQPPKIYQLRDSGSIEQDADTVLLLHAPPDSGNTIEVNVAKQRNGPTGIINMIFNKKIQLFETFAPSL